MKDFLNKLSILSIQIVQWSKIRIILENQSSSTYSFFSIFAAV